jgi:hypothetical protein
MVARRPTYVAIAPLLCPKGVVVELKREIVEGKGGKEGDSGGERRENVVGRLPFFGRLAILGLHSFPTFILRFIFLLSCSLH